MLYVSDCSIYFQELPWCLQSFSISLQFFAEKFVSLLGDSALNWTQWVESFNGRWFYFQTPTALENENIDWSSKKSEKKIFTGIPLQTTGHPMQPDLTRTKEMKLRFESKRPDFLPLTIATVNRNILHHLCCWFRLFFCYFINSVDQGQLLYNPVRCLLFWPHYCVVCLSFVLLSIKTYFESVMWTRKTSLDAISPFCHCQAWREAPDSRRRV